MTADLVFVNAAILTMDPDRPRASTLAIKAGVIVCVGEDASALIGPDTKVIDCRGRTLLPGFVESHLHLVLGGSELTQLQLAGIYGQDAVAAAYEAHARVTPGDGLIMGQGADYDVFGHPTHRTDLDAIAPDRPFAIMAADHHTVWANTRALHLAGIFHGASMPPGHEVVLDANGVATGELREFEAFAPVMALGGAAHLQLGIATGEEPAPWPSAAQQDLDCAAILRGLAHCAAHGITTAINMDGNRYTLSLMQALQDRGALTLRIKVPFHFKPHMDLSALDRASALHAEFNGDWVSSGFVKFFMDGVVDSRTAAMIHPYPGMPDHRSAPLFDPARFAEIATVVDRRGLQIAVHAIGDAAVRITLDGIKAARATNGPRDARHRIEHIEMIDPADIPRLAQLGVTASIQPVHAPGAMDFPIEPTMSVIGWDRAKDAYLCRDLAQSGARIAFASDWPVTDISVLRGIKAALTRPAFDGGTDQTLSLWDVLHAYTAGGAWAAHMDHLTGALRPGLAGDVVVLTGDIEATPADRIDRLGIAYTVAGGRITYCNQVEN